MSGFRTSVAIVVVAVMAGCLNQAGPRLYFRDPKRITVEARGKGSWQTVTPDRYGSYSFGTHRIVGGASMGIPTLVNPWKLGWPSYVLSGRTVTSVFEYAGQRTTMYFDYKVTVPTDNIAKIEEEDVPDRRAGRVFMLAGALVAGLGYLMTYPDTRLIRYPGYAFLAMGGVFAGVGAVNVIRPKRDTQRFEPPGRGTAGAAATPAPVPPTPAGLRWEAWTGTVPADAVIAGAEHHVCRFVHEGALHVGKLHKASTCYIAWGDLEHQRTDRFEVLTGKARWAKQGANGSVVGGIETFGGNNGQPLSVCRSTHAGWPVAGKVLNNTCMYGYGGRAHGVTDFEYLYPAPHATSWATSCGASAYASGGAIELLTPGCHYLGQPEPSSNDYTLTFSARLKNGMGYGLWLGSWNTGNVVGLGVQYDPGAGGIKFLRYPDMSADAFPLLRVPTDNRSHAWSIERRGRRVTIRLDGNVVIDTEIDVGSQFGFRTWAGEASIESLAVKPLTPAP